MRIPMKRPDDVSHLATNGVGGIILGRTWPKKLVSLEERTIWQGYIAVGSVTLV